MFTQLRIFCFIGGYFCFVSLCAMDRPRLCDASIQTDQVPFEHHLDQGLRSENPTALYLQGLRDYFDGTPEGVSLGLEKWERAFEQGSSDAAYYLGRHYLGSAISQSEHGVEWLKKGAARYNATAIRLLADIFAHGKYGIEQNSDEAIRWYHTLFELNHASSSIKEKEEAFKALHQVARLCRGKKDIQAARHYLYQALGSSNDVLEDWKVLDTAFAHNSELIEDGITIYVSGKNAIKLKTNLFDQIFSRFYNAQKNGKKITIKEELAQLKMLSQNGSPRSLCLLLMMYNRPYA